MANNPPSEDEYPWLETTSPPKTRGSFIVIEGLDRAGKTTQAKLLCDAIYASGKNVKRMRFPDRTTPIGQLINTYLQSSTTLPDQSIHLLFSANRWEKADQIRELIAKGYTIVCDRYYYSGMIYTSSKHPISSSSPNTSSSSTLSSQTLSLQWCKSPETGLPKPDVVIFLDLAAEVAEKRGGYGEERYEEREMQRRVREGFLGLGKGDKEGFGDEGRDMRVVDAGGEVDGVAGLVWEVVREVVGREKGDLGVVR